MTRDNERKLMKIDVKSAVAGLVLGVAAMFCMGDAVSGQHARYAVSSTANFVTIIDTQTGEAWGHVGDSTGENSKDGKFWDVKAQ
jgi:hypothetical protein